MSQELLVRNLTKTTEWINPKIQDGEKSLDVVKRLGWSDQDIILKKNGIFYHPVHLHVFNSMDQFEEAIIVYNINSKSYKMYGKNVLQEPKLCKAPKKTVTRKSPYNDFLREEIVRIREANPNMEYKVAFKQAAANWKFSKPSSSSGHSSPSSPDD